MVGAKRPGVLRTNRGIDAAQDDFGVRLQLADVFDNFPHSGIPVRHHRLNKNSIESMTGQKALKLRAWSTKSKESARDVCQSWRLRGLNLIKFPTAKRIAVVRHQVIKCR